MSAVDEMLAALLKREGNGKFTDSPADRGGPTRWGITEQTARAHGYRGDMRMLPRETALDIYRKQFWINPRFYDVSLRYARLGDKLFDIGVNCGPQRASRWLQRALNGFNRGASIYPDVREDGQLGELTLHSLDCYKQHRGDPGEAVVIALVSDQQGMHYLELAERDHTQEANLYGWIANREMLGRCA